MKKSEQSKNKQQMLDNIQWANCELANIEWNKPLEEIKESVRKANTIFRMVVDYIDDLTD